jgi:hypothetical protein
MAFKACLKGLEDIRVEILIVPSNGAEEMRKLATTSKKVSLAPFHQVIS